jgi:hypothetical protein
VAHLHLAAGEGVQHVVQQRLLARAYKGINLVYYKHHCLERPANITAAANTSLC